MQNMLSCVPREASNALINRARKVSLELFAQCYDKFRHRASIYDQQQTTSVPKVLQLISL